MKIVDCATRRVNLLIETPGLEPVDVALVSHNALDGSEDKVVRIYVGDGDIAFSADSRGAAMVLAGEFFRELGLKLLREAFMQEGAVRIRDPK